jgi:hypothetical protein
MEQVREALQKLNVFASCPSRHMYFGISEIMVGKQVEQEHFASVLSAFGDSPRAWACGCGQAGRRD